MKTRAWLFEVCDPNLSGLKRPFRQKLIDTDWDCASNSSVAIMVRGPAHFQWEADAPPVAAFIQRELARHMVFGRPRRVDLEALRSWAAPNGAVVEAGQDDDGQMLYRPDDHQPTTLFGIGVNRCNVWLAMRFFRNPNPDVAWPGSLHTDGEFDPILIVPEEWNPAPPWIVAIMPMKAKIEGDRSAFDAGLPRLRRGARLMLGLTLHRPVDWSMAHAGKDLENRSKKPPKSALGTRIALHAGNEYNYEYADWIKGVLGIAVIPDTTPGVIVATTLIVGWLEVGTDACRKAGVEVLASAKEFVELRESKWFLGPVAWVCRETIALPKPVRCRGYQSLWPVPPEKARVVLEQEQIARSV